MYKNITIPAKELRKEARESLKGNWKNAILGTVFITAILIILSITIVLFEDSGFDGLITIFMFIITGPIILGYFTFLMKIRRGKKVSVIDALDDFENVGKGIILILLVYIKVFLWSLLFLVPGIIAFFNYSLSFVILIDNPDMSPMEAINKSKEMMKGNKSKLFLLFLSFIGWTVLSAGTLVLYFWIIPYMYMALIVFYEKILETCEDSTLLSKRFEEEKIEVNDVIENEEDSTDVNDLDGNIVDSNPILKKEETYKTNIYEDDKKEKKLKHGFYE